MARILFADDDELVAELVSDAFRTHGHDVRTVADGPAAVAAAREAAPDLVILDCSMPGGNGISALRQLRAAGPTARTPVLMLTARRSVTDVEIALREGADDYVMKPFDAGDLVARAEDLLAWRPLDEAGPAPAGGHD